MGPEAVYTSHNEDGLEILFQQGHTGKLEIVKP